MTLKQRAYKHEFQMNETDDDIVQYLLQNQVRIKNLSIHTIAAELFVSPNTIMRLAKKLGYSGFAELKFSLQREADGEQDEESTVGSELLDSLPKNIAKTMDVIDTEKLDLAVETIRDAHCCILAGVGDSDLFCEMLGRYLRCVDVNTHYYSHIHDMVYAVSHGQAEDVLVVISARGRNDRLLKLAQSARKKGMKIISITHFEENPLAAMSDIHLYFWGETQYVQDYNVTDRSGLMVLVRLLCERYWKRFADMDVN